MPDEPDPHPSGADAAARRDLEVLAAYLARRDVAEPVATDVIVLCGSAVLSAVEVTATALRDGVAGRVLISGGRGHSTRYLQDAVRHHPRYADVPTAKRSEAAILADILRRHLGVSDAAIALEEKSTNCGENAAFSVETLHREPQPVRSMLLIQDPTMQRRTHASFERALRDSGRTTVRSYAPFVPVVGNHAVKGPDGRTVWSLRRFTGLVLGELRRLHDDEHGYGPRGADFIDHIDIPEDVMKAYGHAATAHPGSVREAWTP